MSLKMMIASFNSEVGSSIRKLILVKLADNANEETGECWPSYSTIAKHCECSRMTVIRAIKQLELDGFIKVVRSKSGNKKNNSNKYYLFPNGITLLLGGNTELLGGGNTELPESVSIEPTNKQSANAVVENFPKKLVDEALGMYKENWIEFKKDIGVTELHKNHFDGLNSIWSNTFNASYRKKHSLEHFKEEFNNLVDFTEHEFKTDPSSYKGAKPKNFIWDEDKKARWRI